MKITEPIAVDGPSLVFGGDIKKLLPAMVDIPEEFKCHNRPTEWNQLFSTLFFCGGSIAHLVAKPGIDKTNAIKHIRACMASWEPKHEHKEAGCAYLFSLWFEPQAKPEPVTQ